DEIAALALGERIIEPGEIAFGALDLDDVGSRIGQTRGAERRGHGLFDGNNGDPLKRQHGVSWVGVNFLASPRRFWPHGSRRVASATLLTMRVFDLAAQKALILRSPP